MTFFQFILYLEQLPEPRHIVIVGPTTYAHQLTLLYDKLDQKDVVLRAL
jgi:hypothetical protein